LKNKIITSSLIKLLAGKESQRTPIWFMRQAGRYLPEYRKIRKEAGSFLNICMDYNLATEITLQPAKRFDLDAVIVFSDILTIPMALDREVEFKEKEGPIINRITSLKEIRELECKKINFLEPVYKTIHKVKTEKPMNCALIGFSGAPFTLACYLLQGSGKEGFKKCVDFFRKEEDYFLKLLEKLEEFISIHLINQIKSGADVVQIFDSHAHIALANNKLREYCINPVRKIIKKVKNETEGAYIICFPRNIGSKYTEYIASLDLDGISLDHNINRKELIKNNNKEVCYQGNLSPETLVEGGKKMEEEVKSIISDFSKERHIFNLGHGVLKETNPDNILELIKIIRSLEK